MLEALDRGNLFLVSLDDRRRWYRYHQLFADVLRRASSMSNQRGCPTYTSGPATGTNTTATALRRSVTQWPLRTSSEWPAWLSWHGRRCGRVIRTRWVLAWLRTLPDELVGEGRSSALPTHGRCYRAASSRTSSVAWGDGERWLTATDGVPDEPGAGRPEMVVVDRREFSLLAALIAVYRAVLCPDPRRRRRDRPARGDALNPRSGGRGSPPRGS